MIKLAPIIIPGNRLKDGSYPVKIRVYHKGKVRRLPTQLFCFPKDLTRSLKIKKDSLVYAKAEELTRRILAVVADLSPFDIESHDVDWAVAKIKDGMTKESFSLDFFLWSDSYLKSKSASTRRAYDRALNALERFLGKREIDINAFTKMLLLDFMEFVDAEPKMYFSKSRGCVIATNKEKASRASSSLHLMKLQHIFNAAKYRYNDEDAGVIRIPRSPFDSIKKIFPSGGKGQTGLERDIIQALISARESNDAIRTAIDVFLLSFCTMGANLADIYNEVTFEGDIWVYRRQKVRDRRPDGAELRVNLHPQAKMIISRLSKGRSRWWLPALHRMGSTLHTCNEKVNAGLRKWQKRNGVEDFTFYAARHSWGSIARSLGYDLALINDCLCHKDALDDGRRYAPSSWEQRNAVNKAVIESFQW